MSTNAITIAGNLTTDPELRFTSSGKPVANFTVADTPRHQDPASGEWKDGEALFQRVAVWGEVAENVKDSLAKGMRVIVSGRLVQKSFTKDGETRNYTEIRADEVGPSLKYAKASVSKVARKNGVSSAEDA
jgi:single-strand DNA-binding protein